MSTAYKKMTSHGSISIPVAMRRELGIEPKDPMIVEEHQGEIRIKPYTLRCNFCGTTEDVHEFHGTVKSMTNEQLIGACVWLDREQKKSRAMMNSYKAELQARGLAIMEDHNVKYVKFYGDEGSAAITDSMSLDILNPDKLKELVGEGVYKMKVKEETKTTYKFDSKFEKAMKAIFTGDYTFETTLEEFLDEMSIKPDDKQKKLLLKKLKGEFEKDKETLISVLVPEGETVPDFDVELWYIYRIKNGELIKAFLPEEMIDAIIEGIRKSIFVETKTSITLDYDDTEKED